MPNYNQDLQNSNNTIDEVLSLINNLPIYVDTADATIDTSSSPTQSNEVFLNKTAYKDGKKVSGTFTIQSEINSQVTLLANLKLSLLKKVAHAAPTILQLTVTTNGLYRAPTGVDGYSPILVNVPLTTQNPFDLVVLGNVSIFFTAYPDGTANYIDGNLQDINVTAKGDVYIFDASNIGNPYTVTGDILLLEGGSLIDANGSSYSEPTSGVSINFPMVLTANPGSNNVLLEISVY